MDQLLAIRIFIRVAEAGSFAKAADGLDMPRSSASKLVQDLEAHLGAKLLERTTRSVTLTQEGAAYRDEALRLLANLEDMDARATQARAAPKGRLRVDLGSVLANRILIPALADFERRFPEIELMLGVGDRSTDLIGEGIDCVIRGGALADSSLKARKLCELDYTLCATPAFLEGKVMPDHPSALAHHRIVSYFSASRGNRFPLKFEKDGERIEIAATRGFAVNDSTAHLTALLAGLGIGQSFGFLARPYIEQGRLVELFADWKPENHDLHLLYPADRFENPRLKAFIDWVTPLFDAVDSRRRMRP